MSGAFYVYEHWRTDTNLPFYVGKGKEKRAFDFVGRSKHHKNVVTKVRRMGFAIKVIKVFSKLDEETAFLLEKFTIAYWREQEISLVNVTDGGEGTAGLRWTDEQKVRSSKAAQERWKRLDYQENFTRAHRAALASAEVRARIKEAVNRPTTKAKKSAEMKSRWELPGYREKMIEIFNRPEMLAANSKRGKERTASSEFRKKRSDQVKALWADPEFRKQMLESLNKPETKEKHSAIMKEINNRSEVKAKKKETRNKPENRERWIGAIKRAYQDPKLLIQISEAVKAAKSSPEHRAMMSEVGKAAQARPEVKERQRAAVKEWWARRKVQQHSMSHSTQMESAHAPA